MQPATPAPAGRASAAPSGRRSFSGGARPLPDGWGFAARRTSLDASRRASLSIGAGARRVSVSGDRGDGLAPPLRATAAPDAPVAPAPATQDFPIPDKGNPARKPRILIAGGGIGGTRMAWGEKRVCARRRVHASA